MLTRTEACNVLKSAENVNSKASAPTQIEKFPQKILDKVKQKNHEIEQNIRQHTLGKLKKLTTICLCMESFGVCFLVIFQGTVKILICGDPPGTQFQAFPHTS